VLLLCLLWNRVVGYGFIFKYTGPCVLRNPLSEQEDGNKDEDDERSNDLSGENVCWKRDPDGMRRDP